jgi:ABC-type transport system involved in cytochrome bd biosynthesis fused ATPase/permease subunit
MISSLSEESKYDQIESGCDAEMVENLGETTTPNLLSNFQSLHCKVASLIESTIVWRRICKHVEVVGKDKKSLQILFNASGVAKAGEMCAVMGPSGSGKTALLNVLSGRSLSNTTGEVLINNVHYTKSMRRTIGYVMQEDVFYSNLTVRQQLYFTSHLRLADSMPAAFKLEAVDEVIRILRMERCADTKICLVSGVVVWTIKVSAVNIYSLDKH